MLTCFWYPADNVVHFKRDVYLRALHHLAPIARSVAGHEVIEERAPPERPEPRGYRYRQRRVVR